MTRVLVFDVGAGGHHGSYIDHLLRLWPEPSELIIAVTERFIEVHSPVIGRAREAGAEVLALESVGRALAPRWPRSLERLRPLGTAVDEWRLLGAAARAARPDRCLAMYADRLLQAPLALGLRAPAPLSGIYFRPTFHYRAVLGQPLSARETARAWRQRVAVAAALRNPSLRAVLSLDPFAVAPMNAMPGRRATAVPLADPVQGFGCSRGDLEALRGELGIGRGRRVALLFGAIGRRKGVVPLLGALRQLPTETASQLCLLVVGTVAAGERGALEPLLAAAQRDADAEVRIVDRFVADAEIERYFAIADVILAPYQRHVGMSGILVRAARAGRPVLASDWGLLGALVRRHHLGLAVDSSSHEALARGLEAVAAGRISWDREAARRFGEANSPEAFVATIAEHLGYSVTGLP